VNLYAHLLAREENHAARVAEQDGVTVAVDEVVHFPPCAFDPKLVASIESGAAALGYSVRRIASGAGHDAVYVARHAPTAMIFVPCKDGISHNEIEDARPEHLTAGASVLLHAMLEQAGVAGPA
jgi:N-carbamoyl-L-amino-acid hydrolase